MASALAALRAFWARLTLLSRIADLTPAALIMLCCNNFFAAGQWTRRCKREHLPNLRTTRHARPGTYDHQAAYGRR